MLKNKLARLMLLANLFLIVRESSGAELHELIDREVAKSHESIGDTIAPRCSDADFLRRVHLDLIGTVPSPQRVVEFLADHSPGKREALIDELIDSPGFGRHTADIWSEILLHPNLDWPEDPFVNWLAEKFQDNTRWNRLCFDMLTAVGPQYQRPEVTVFMVGSDASLSPQDATDLVGRAFMGVTLECAQCHDHPDGDWTHRQYWGIASFLGGTRVSSGFPDREHGPKRTDWEKQGTIFGVKNADSPKARLPERALAVPATLPDGRSVRILHSDFARNAFAEWLCETTAPLYLSASATQRSKPGSQHYLARAFVNRTWHQLFGCGIVTPVDDHRVGNPPLHPDLQTGLTEAFLNSDYNVKELYRGICRSQTYQQESTTHQDPRSLNGTNLRVTSPNQVFDMIHTILGEESVANTWGIYGKRGARRAFVRSFGDEAGRGNPVRFSKSIPDFLRLMNSFQIEGGIRKWVETSEHLHDDARRMIDTIYLTVLSRHPSERELDQVLNFVRTSNPPQQGYESLMWVLLNSSDFYVIP